MMSVLYPLLAAIVSAAQTFNWSCDTPTTAVRTDESGYSRLLPEGDDLIVDISTTGKPALPQRSVLFAVPNGYALSNVTHEIVWETLTASVRLLPVQEVTRDGEEAAFTQPDAETYGAERYPAEPLAVRAPCDVGGVQAVPIAVTPYRWHPRTGLLERATSVRISVTFAPCADATSLALSPAMAESARLAVVNPSAVSYGARSSLGRDGARPSLLTSAAPNALLTASAETTDPKPGYLLIAPPDFYADWQWYAKKRAEVHPDVAFYVKNTADIYALHPFGEGLDCRNAAESLHAFIRGSVATNNIKYVVLGGAWLNAQTTTKTYFATGDEMTLSNCVPGIIGYPREDWRKIPSDMFYACLGMSGGVQGKAAQKYPWDANENGIYIDQADCPNNDLVPDVAVSRITLNPWNGTTTPYDMHALITNYVAKLARGESPTFAGHYRYGVSGDSTGSRRSRASSYDRMYYKELEFYDGMYNMFDPRHNIQHEDDEKATRERFHGQFSKWRPVKSVKGMYSFNWTVGFDYLWQAIDDYYASDMDYGFVYSHGWAQGATHFQASRFGSGTGLTLLNGSNGPCDTGYPDYYVTYNGKSTLAYNLGDSGVMNPKGGALCSINNTRWGWAGGSNGYDESMSYLMLNRSLIAFNEYRWNVGDAWLKATRDYANCGGPQWGSTSTWTLTEQICYGDPLVQLPVLESVSYTNETDTVFTTDVANDVYFNTTGDRAFAVTNEVAVMRLSIPVRAEGATFRLTGGTNGSLRVMKRIDVAGTNTTLSLNVKGGVGHDGVTFVTEPGEVTFEGQNKFYLAKVTNAKRVNLNGGNVTLDLDEFPSAALPLAFDGPGLTNMVAPNELRSSYAGGLTRFGPLNLTNTWVKLATLDGFGNAAPMTNTLSNAKLEIAANVYYQRSGSYPEGLNAYFNVVGDSSVVNSEGGLWTVKHTTTFDLAKEATLTLAAETANAGGAIVLTGEGEVRVAKTSALAGSVTVASGITLVLDQVPLPNVTALTIADGAKVVLPDDASGYWQVIPVSSKLVCGENVAFYAAGDRAAELEGSPSLTGAFFKEGALYRWTKPCGDWDAFIANRYPKILFGDVAGNAATVRVTQVVSPTFAFFANATTRYRFERAADDAAVIFQSILFCGETTFDVPVSATAYVELESGTTTLCRVIAPYVHVGAGASLALAGSHATTFNLEDGAILKAVPNEALDWNAETQFTFADGATITIDAADLVLTEEPTVIIAGRGHTFTPSDLTRYALSRADAELRIVDGALAIVKGDALKGPFALSFGGAADWDDAPWRTTNGVPLPKRWSDCALDWRENLFVTATNAGENVLSVNADVHAQSLTFAAPTNSTLKLVAAGEGALAVTTLNFADCLGDVTLALPSGSAAIVAPTNETSTLTLAAAGEGAITLKNGALVMCVPGGWTLNAGAQGMVRVYAPQAYERFRIARVSDGFERGGLSIEILDAAGKAVDGFTVTVSDNALWCEPPALQAEVPAGTNEIHCLVWKDVFGNVASNVDWTASAGFKLIGTPESGVVTAKDGFTDLWTRLSVSNNVTLYGNDTLSPKTMPSGSGTLTLAGGFTVNVNLKTTPQILNNTHLGIGAGSVMNIAHGGAHDNVSGQNWRGIVGTGTLHFTGGNGNWISVPSDIFAATLTVVSDCDIVLTEGISRSNPFGVRNFAGSGTFRSDWGGGSKWRPVRTVQTGVTTYSGALKAIDNGRDSALIVASDDAAASTNKALVLSAAAIADHTLEIETNGCVILTGSWKGPITVSGLLIVTNAAAIPANATTLGNGRIEVIAPEDLPPDTLQPAYVPPTYPEDPEEPDEPDVPSGGTRSVASAVWATVPTRLPGARANFSALDWRDATNGVVAAVDWSAVTNAVLSAAAVSALTNTVMMDVTYAGALTFAGVRLENHASAAYTLGAGSCGSVVFRLTDAPTTSFDLVRVAADFGDDASVLSVAVGDAYGRALATPGEVTFDGAKFYYYIQDIQHPTWSATFENSTRSTLSTCPGWAGDTYDANNFTDSRSGRALRSAGYCPYINGNLPGSNGCVTHHVVMRLPAEENRMMVCCGAPGNAYEIWFVSSGGDSLILRNGDRVLLTVPVPLATKQFHAYAAVMDSTTLKLYVDGALAASCPYGGIPSAGMQFFKVHGGGSFAAPSSTSSAAIDDWRSYDYLLTEASIRALADEFAPWPETPEALIDIADLGWDDLAWSRDIAGEDALTLRGAGGGLRITNRLEVAAALSVVGEPITITLSDAGELVVPNGIALAPDAYLTIDISDVDLTQIAANAVCGAPYTYWVVRGGFAGSFCVTGQPKLPKGYMLGTSVSLTEGVRLAIHAPDYARFESMSFNFAGDQNNANASGSRVSDNAAYNALFHGVQPVLGYLWHDLAAAEQTTTFGDVTVKVSQIKNPYRTGKTMGDQILYGYVDDGNAPIVQVSGIPFARYRVIAYCATDSDNYCFAPVQMGATANDALYYYGPTANTSISGYTVGSASPSNWGNSNERGALAEGLNYVISDVITNGTAYIHLTRNDKGRGCLAAFQIVEVRAEPANENNVVPVVTIDPHAWTNPVTGVSQNFSYRFTGAVSEDWKDAANWQVFAPPSWSGLPNANVPYYNNIYSPVVFDGVRATLDGKLEGWCVYLAALNGANVTVGQINKFQGDGAAMWLWVDETSHFEFAGVTASPGNNGGTIGFYVAASNGLHFARYPSNGSMTFEYHLKGVGSVGYDVALAACSHKICRADFALSPTGVGKAVRRKLLVSYPSASVTFVTADAAITLTDPAGEITGGTRSVASVSADDVLGAYCVTQCTDGVYLDYVDRAESAPYVHEYDTTNGVARVKIPTEWLMTLTNAAVNLLTPANLTPAKIAAALESDAAPNRVKPWQSYLLGLDPASAHDDVHCEIAFTADSALKVHLPNVDPTRQPLPDAVEYVLQHKEKIADDWQDHPIQQGHSSTLAAPDAASGFFRYVIRFK